MTARVHDHEPQPVHEQVLDFWFGEIQPARWGQADPVLDTTIRQRFGDLHRSAHLGELWHWRTLVRGRLAEIIILDQFSRNMFRGNAQSFASDPMALALAQEVIAGGYEVSLPAEQRLFLYMPYQHSESRRVHVQAEYLFARLALGDHYDDELRHKAVIDRFGRYPHRNVALGRTSTQEELAFLEQPGSRF